MKRNPLFFLLIFIFGLCGAMGTMSLQSFYTNAASLSADEWDGKYPQAVTDTDWFGENDSFYIRSAKGLAYFAKLVKEGNEFIKTDGNPQTVYLDADINLAEQQWTPVMADNGNAFNGIFNGQGHTIYGLKITDTNSSNTDNIGFFARVGLQAKIENLNFKDVNISSTGANAVGTFVGDWSLMTPSPDWASAAQELSNCSVSGQMSVTNCQNVGGLMGIAGLMNVQNCSADVSITESASTVQGSVGGLIGFAKRVKMEFCYNQGDITINAMPSGNVGGLIGNLETDYSTLRPFYVKDCYNVGNLLTNEAGIYVGGLIGRANCTSAGAEVGINHVYNAGNMEYAFNKTRSYVGGLIGFVEDTNTALKNALNLGQMESKNYDAGVGDRGISHIANGTTSKILNAYYIEDEGPSNSTKEDFAPLTNLYYLARSRGFYENDRYFENAHWAFDGEGNHWRFGELNDGLPYFALVSGLANNEYKLRGEGTEQNPYIIETAADLAQVSLEYSKPADTESPAKHYVLKNDINLLGRTWTPIGTGRAFDGVFDGNGHSISGISCSLQEAYSYIGLFGRTENAIIRYLTIKDVNYLGGDENTTCGTFIGQAEGTTYLIGCNDQSGKNSVGASTGTLYNVIGAEGDLLNLSSISKIDAFDIVVNGAGGNFYDTKKDDSVSDKTVLLDAQNMYLGEYHIIVNASKNVLVPTAEYGKTLLPRLSTEIGKADILIKRGFKLSGYTYNKDGSDVDLENIDVSKATSGLTAKWAAEGNKNITIVYNKYEIDNFNATQNAQADYIDKYITDEAGTEIMDSEGQRVKIQMQGKQVVAKFVMEYDSFFSEYQELFKLPYYNAGTVKALRDGNFTMLMYIDEEFSDLVSGSGIVNDSLSSLGGENITLYAKWTGSTEKNYHAKLSFSTNDNGITDLDQAISNVEMTVGRSDEEETSKSGEKVDQAKSTQYNFSYDTTLSDSKNNYFGFEVVLNPGYTFAGGSGSSTYSDFWKTLQSGVDTNFGALTVENNGGSVVGNNIFAKASEFSAVKFYNLYQDFDIPQINIERETYTETFDVDKNIYSALGANEVFTVSGQEGEYTSNLQIQNSSGDWVDILTAFSATEVEKGYWAEKGDLNIAFDFIHNKVLLSTDKYDSQDFDKDTYTYSEQINLKYNGEAEYHFEISKQNISDDELTTIQLFSATKQEAQLEIYGKSTSGEDKLTTHAFDSFVLLFSTENQNVGDDNESISFTRVDYFGSKSWVPENLKFFKNGEEKPTKVKFAIESAMGYGGGTIFVQTSFTEAHFSFKFYKNETPFAENAPAFTGKNNVNEGDEKVFDIINGVTLDLQHNGSVEFDVENSDYYRLKSVDGIKISVESVPDAQAQFQQDFNGDSFANYITLTQNPFAAGENNQAGAATNHPGYTVKFDYNLGSGRNLVAGEYLVKIYCEDVPYTVNFGTKFVENGFNNIEDLFSNPDTYNQENSLITTTINSTSAQDATDTVFGSTVKFDDDLTFNTQLGDDKGYVFAGWYLKTEDGAISNKKSAQFAGKFKDFYNVVKKSTCTLTAYATYTRKQFVLQTKNGEVQNEGGRAIGSVSASMDRFVYNYNLSSNLSITLSLEGKNKDSYYFGGLKFVDEQGYSITDTLGSELNYDVLFNSAVMQYEGSHLQMTIDFSQENWLTSKIKDGTFVDGATSKTYYIVPILTEKKAKIYFHSGTGENEYGDKNIYGQVFNVSGESTTDEDYVTAATYSVGETIFSRDASILQNGNDLSAVNLFYSRTGYTSQNYWGWSSVDVLRTGTSGLDITLINEMFADKSTAAGGDIEIHLYRLWSAITYTITFNKNNGLFADLSDDKTVNIAYDQSFDAISAQIPTEISRNGYNFKGWADAANVLVFDESGALQDTSKYFREDRTYQFANNLVLFARWEEKTYKIEIDFNNANTFLGQEEWNNQFTLKYDHTFAEIVWADGVTGVLALTEENVTRPGFVFDGLYLTSENDGSSKIANATMFNSDLQGFVFGEEGVALKLYVGWTKSETYFNLSLLSNVHESLTYNDADQTVDLYDFFKQENIASQSGFVIDAESFIGLQSEVKAANLLKALSVEEETGAKKLDDRRFSVKECGRYVVTFVITITDTSSIRNCGTIWEQTYEFEIEVLQAALDLAAPENTDFMIKNLKRMAENFVTEEVKTRLNEAMSLHSIVSILSPDDTGLSAVSGDTEIYNFFMTKYYLLAHTNNSADHRTYYNYTYSQFLEFKNQPQYAQILENIRFFTFFNFLSTESSQELVDYPTVLNLKAGSGFEPQFVNISKVMIVSGSGNALQARSSTNSVYVYVYSDEQKPTAINNYNLQHDDNGYYFVASYTAYVMPQVLNLENKSPRASDFYSDLYIEDGTRAVEFAYGQEYNISGTNYYKLDENANYYISLSLNTSGVGSADEDTEFAFNAQENYLYISNLNIILQQDNRNYYVTDNFKVQITPESIYTILSTAGVANLIMSGKYLTMDNNYVELNDFSAEYKVLKITRVKTDTATYNAKQIEETGGYINGVRVFSIISNNANEVEIQIGRQVQSVSFSAEVSPTPYISLFKWSDQPVYSVEGSQGVMEKEDTKIITREKVDELASKEIVTLQYYAIFTDLVEIEWDFNFPSDYQVLSYTAPDFLQLGKTVTQDIFPQVSGFGKAVQVQVVTEQGEEDYLSLNNSGNVFAGINPQNKFQPVTLSAKWAVDPDIEHTDFFEETTVAVYTYQTLDYSMIAYFSNLNAEIFNYTFTWSAEYDNSQEEPLESFVGESLTLVHGGSVKDSGTYTLQVVGAVKDTFISSGALAEPGKNTCSCTITFKITFVGNKLVNVEMPEDMSAVYDGNEHRGDFSVSVQYQQWSNYLGDYSPEIIEENDIQYPGTGLFTFSINDGETETIVNAGTYVVRLNISDDLFAVNDYKGSTQFNFVITPKSVDLSAEDYKGLLSASKTFNQKDPALVANLLVEGREVSLQLSRDKSKEHGGEDLGEYDIFLQDVISENKGNYKLVFTQDDGSEVELFDGTNLKNLSTVIGKFTITETDRDLEVILTSNQMEDKVVQRVFNDENFTLQIQGSNLIIKNAKLDNIEMQISLFDMAEKIEDTNILEILTAHLQNVPAMFAKQAERFAEVKNADLYNFALIILDTTLADYYNNIVISPEYALQIMRKVIQMKDISVDKEFDNKDENIFEVEKGLKVKARYESVHAGTVKVWLDPMVEEGYNLDNYTFESKTTTAKISPIEAKLTLGTQKSNYVYGEVNISDLAAVFKPTALHRQAGNEAIDLTWLTGHSDEYRISYSFTKDGACNARGWLYKGQYSVGEEGCDIQIEAFFRDFIIEFEEISLSINVRKVQKNIPDNFITILQTEKPKEYYEDILKIAETGDEITLKYTVSLPQPVEIKQYPLVLSSDYDTLNGSIEVSINEDNKGFNVIASNAVVVVSISAEEAEKLKPTYNSEEFAISTDAANKKLIFTNTKQEKIEIQLSINIEGEGDAATFQFDTLNIFSSADSGKVTAFEKAGKYLLSLEATDAAGAIHTFRFDKAYFFEIKKVEIDAAQLKDAFNKIYDGGAQGKSVGFSELVAGDNASVVGTFRSSNVGNNLTVTLTLSGDDYNNYTFKNNVNTTTSNITQATASIELDGEMQDEAFKYTYGQIVYNDEKWTGLNFVVQANGQSISSSTYSINVTINNQQHSAAGYLLVNTYTISVTGQFTSSASNYKFDGTPYTANIVVVQREFNITFAQKGQIKVQFGSEQWQNLKDDGKFDYTIAANSALSPLGEEVQVNLAVKNVGDKAIGFYYIDDAGYSKNENYKLGTVTDTVQAFEITQSREFVVAMVDDGGSGTNVINTTYDGYTYDNMTIENEGGNWLLYLVSTASGHRKQVAKLAFFLQGGISYTGNIENLTSQFLFDPIKNVQERSYEIRAYSSSSTTNDLIRLGSAEGASFLLNVLPKELFFKSNQFIRPFINDNAIFEEDASTLLSGQENGNAIVGGDEVTLTVELHVGDENGEYAKYYSDKAYAVKAILGGQGAANYTVKAQTVSGQNVDGMISRRPITIIFDSRTSQYGILGRDMLLEYESGTFDVDFNIVGFNLKDYLDAGRAFKLSIGVPNLEDNLSSSGKLKVGVYHILANIGEEDNCDFTLGTYIIDGAQATDNPNAATISVMQVNLQAVQKETRLEEVFTKDYDGNRTAEIYDGGAEVENLKFNLSGYVEGDELTLSAEYSALQGKNLTVTFTLSGKDKENYTMSNFVGGNINAVEILLEYANAEQYNLNVQDDVLLKKLAYPFVPNSNYLTSNAYDNAKAYTFPTAPTKTGYAFTGWTLNFASLTEAQYKILSDKCGELNISTSGDAANCKVAVGNVYETVQLLSALISSKDFDLLYYENPEVKVVFNDNWEIEKYDFEVKIVDIDTNEQAPFGTVTSTIFAGDALTGEVEHGSQVILRVKAKAHATFINFMIENGQVITSGMPGYTLGESAGEIVLTIQNVTSNMTILARFQAEKVNLILDISKFSEKDKADATLPDNRFVKGTDNFTWRASWFALENMTFGELPQMNLPGRTLKRYTRSEEVFEQDRFAEKIMPDGFAGGEIVLEPGFDANTITVTLDYGYGGTREEIQVVYGKKYGDASGWPATDPLRDGYTFAGWYLNDQEKIEGTSTVLQAEEHTLVAKWTANKYAITFTLKHAKISTANITFSQEGDVATATAEYNTIVSITFVADAGFRFAESWDQPYATYVQVTQNGQTASLRFTMPNNALENFVVPVEGLPNTVTFAGEHLGSVDVFDITQEKQTIDVEANQFTINSGRKFRFEVHAEEGYQMSQAVLVNGSQIEQSGLKFSKTIQNEVLILEIDSITQSISITFAATLRENEVTISFKTPAAVEKIYFEEREYTPSNLPVLKVVTNSQISIIVKFVEGNTYVSYNSENVQIDVRQIFNGTYAGCFEFTISANADGSAEIVSEIMTFTINLNVISYNDQFELEEVPENRLYVLRNGEEQTSFVAEYGTYVALMMSNAPSYFFSGWSFDGENIISAEDLESQGFAQAGNVWTYHITKNADIYVVFAESAYTITLGTIDYVYVESTLSQIDENYITINAGKFFEADGTTPISSFEIVYMDKKSIVFEVPTGYNYIGFGYYRGDQFVDLVAKQVSTQRQVMVEIDTKNFGTDNVREIYLLVVSQSSRLRVRSMIDYNGTYVEDTLQVGSISLVSENGGAANAAGYIDGTRVHYENLNSGTRDFAVIAYTNDVVYLKVNPARKGYQFEKVVVNNENNLQCSLVQELESGWLYKIEGIVGGINDIEIQVLYQPDLNVIELSFLHENLSADGGAIEAYCAEDNRIWVSGSDYSSIYVTAFTDVKFTVTAYIRAGFYVQEDGLVIIDEDNIVVPNSLSFQGLSIERTGYTGKITFQVYGFEVYNKIQIVVHETKYTVQFKDGDNVLATIKNVGFNTDLTKHLSQDNAENIQSNLGYVGGILNLTQRLDKHYFVGYFTYENGAGVQYINSAGNANGMGRLENGTWQENGYVYNSITGLFELSNNAVMDENGNITISLFLYMSYLKTRFHFEFVPAINTNIGATSIVSGVDYTNSWYYEASPNYIEVSFNTDIYITAPKIDGYEFYKFVFSQRTLDGTQLTDWDTFSDSVPWSTNDVEQVVEVVVKAIYFAKIDVVVIGGEGENLFTYVQGANTDQKAQQLLAQGYVDTSSTFAIELNEQVLEEKGFSFRYWSFLNQTSTEKTITLTTSRKMQINLYLEGKTVTLDFSEYSADFGVIVSMNKKSLDGTNKNITLGEVRTDGTFSKNPLNSLNPYTSAVKVGDTITFIVATSSDYAVSWNREDITLAQIVGNRLHYTFKVTGADANKRIAIVPYFTNAYKTVYISRAFADGQILENALDLNNVDMAGVTTYQGRQTSYIRVNRDSNIEFNIVTMPRYYVHSISITGLSGQPLTDMGRFFTDGKVVLTNDLLNEFGISGTISVEIKFARLLWQDVALEIDALPGSGTAKNPYQIRTVEDLILMMLLVNGGQTNKVGNRYADCAYIMYNNIDLGAQFWTPIGTTASPFNGSFNFNRHSASDVANATIYPTINYGGLFGVIGANATFYNGGTSIWYVYLIVAVTVLLIVLLVVLIFRNRKKKKENDELARKA